MKQGMQHRSVFAASIIAAIFAAACADSRGLTAPEPADNPPRLMEHATPTMAMLASTFSGALIVPQNNLQVVPWTGTGPASVRTRRSGSR